MVVSEFGSGSNKVTTIETISSDEYLATVNDYGQRFASGSPIAQLSIDTDAETSDISQVEISLPQGYSGGYKLYKGAGQWDLTAKSFTVDEDVLVLLDVTFRDGTTARDQALLKIRNQEILFSKCELSLETRQDKTLGDIDLIDQDEYQMIAGTYKGIAKIDTGVVMSVPRIKNAVTITSSDPSVLTVSTVRSIFEEYEFYVMPVAAGDAILTVSATDDSGVPVTKSINVTVEERNPITDFTVVTDSEYATGNESDGFVVQGGHHVKFGITNITPQDYNIGGLSLPPGDGTYFGDLGETTHNVSVYYTNNNGIGVTIKTKTVNVTVVGLPQEDVFATSMPQSLQVGDTFEVYLKFADDDIGNISEAGVANWSIEDGEFEFEGESYVKKVTCTILQSGTHELGVLHFIDYSRNYYTYKFSFTAE